MFLSLTVNANFWSSTQNDATQAWSRYLSCDYDNIRQQKNPKQYSYSIRCVQDCNSAPSSPSEGIHVSNSTTQIIWNWNAIPGAIGYKWNTINDYSSATDMGSATTKTETGLTSNTYYTRFVWAYNPCGISLGTTLIWHTALFDIGQSYGGGIIFYIDGTGQHGLISATNDQGSGAVWGCYGTLIGGTSTAIGTGQANTSSIVSRCIEGNAARTCNDLVLNGYDDWFLPSKDELNQMFLQKGIIGGFVPGYYWSSSEYNTNLAWYQSFYNGNQEWGVKNSATGFVRAVRSF